MQWEYKTISFRRPNWKNASKEFNKHGQEGWELIAISDQLRRDKDWIVAWFKRPKTDNRSAESPSPYWEEIQE